MLPEFLLTPEGIRGRALGHDSQSKKGGNNDCAADPRRVLLCLGVSVLALYIKLDFCMFR